MPIQKPALSDLSWGYRTGRKIMRHATLLKLFTIVPILLIMAGCASKVPLGLSMNQLKGQTIIYNSGKPTIVSTKALTVAASATDKIMTEKGEYLAVRLVFSNTTNRAINVIPGNIEAFGNRGMRLDVLSSSQQELVIEDEHKAQRIALALQGFGLGLQGSGSKAHHSGTITGNTYSGTSTYTGDNTYKMQAFERDVAQLKTDIRNEKENYLKHHTLFPGNEYYGSIWIKKPAEFLTPFSLVLNVPVENESHRFEIIIDKMGT